MFAECERALSKRRIIQISSFSEWNKTDATNVHSVYRQIQCQWLIEYFFVIPKFLYVLRHNTSE